MEEEKVTENDSLSKDNQIQESVDQASETAKEKEEKLQDGKSPTAHEEVEINKKDEPKGKTRRTVDAAKDETDTEEAGYKSDESASEEGSTDNVVDRRRSKGSSGYEESDDYEEGSDLSEGQRLSKEDEDSEYDEGVSENSSSDVEIEESHSERDTEGYEEDKEDESKEEGGEDVSEELEKTDPQNVPRRTGFWDHDDRYDEIAVEESRAPRNDRKLWDRTAERWQHDKYVLSEQGPKEQWEIEEFEKQRGGRNQRRNQRNLGDFMRGGRDGRGRRGERGGRGRKLERNQRDVEEDGQQGFHRSQTSHLRGSPRGRSDFRKARPERIQKVDDTEEWGGDEEVKESSTRNKENVNDVEDELRNDSKPQRAEKREPVVEHKHVSKINSPKSQAKENIGSVNKDDEKRQAERSTMKSQESHASPSTKKKEPQMDHHGPRGRGKGVTSKKTTSAKKTAVDFRKERKKSEESAQKDEDIYEDAEENVKGDVDGIHHKQAVKPKRYSTQRQKPTNTSEAPQNQNDDTSIQSQQYFDANLQGNYQPQELAFNPNMLVFLQQQLQAMSQQQQPMQQGQPIQQQSQPVQQQQSLQQQHQVPGPPGQGPAVLTPSMQQYMQQQFLNMQALQQMYTQQQQQMQQQMQGIRLNQPQSLPSSDPQAQASEGGMMMPRNAFSNVSPNVQHYNIIQQNQPGLYSQDGTQYAADQMMATRPSNQQPGLYIPPVQQVPQQQGPTDVSVEQYAQRKPRPAAIPIKPPPEVQ